MLRVFLSFPYTGAEKKAKAFGRELSRFLVKRGINPLCPHIYYPQFLSNSGEGYNFALECCKDLLSISSYAIFIVPESGRLSKGMCIEETCAIELDVRRTYLSKAFIWEGLTSWVKSHV